MELYKYLERGSRILDKIAFNFFKGMRQICCLNSGKFRHYVTYNSRAKVNLQFYNDYLLGPSLKVFVTSLTRNFLNYAPLLSRDSEDSDDKNKKQRTPSKNAKDSLISLIKENDKRSVMSLSDAEKYAKRKNMTLVELPEASRPGKVVYKLEKKFDGIEAKIKGKEMKRMYLKEEIQLHDLQIKINQMLKFLEKDLEVVCLLVGKKEKLNGILSVLENSQLKDHFISKIQSKKGFTLVYKKESTENNEKPKGKNEDDIESSKEGS